MKIWSLLPSATEMLFALGLDDEITGVTHECDYPPKASAKPRVTLSHIDSAQDSGEIDRQVTERFKAGPQLYGIDEDRLRSDPPDLIVTQDLCPVCAVSPSDFTGHMDAAGCSAGVVCLNPNRLGDVLDSIRQIGEATDRRQEAADLVVALERRIDAVCAATADAARRRVLALEWLDPPMPGGHWVPEVIELAGGTRGPIALGEPSQKLPWDEMRAIDPEIIVLMPCGFGPERAASEAAVLWRLEGWSRLPAVRKGHVYAVDGNAYFSRPGPRLVDGLEMLAHIFHPELFRKMPRLGSVLKLVSPPAGASSVENWTPRFEPLLAGV
ncbi:MAG TPA: cobalamin-binding protein, partial [Dehalococcoidia bacterium]|nr:cobalamin-binding protein [Dehalococcoidia bacterium]